MLASLSRDAAALDMGGGAVDYSSRGGLLVPSHVAQHDEPELATVRELHPAATETEETPAVDDEPEPAPEPEPEPEPEPDFECVPSPQSAVAVTARPAVTPTLIKVEPLPPRPKPEPPAPEPASPSVEVEAEPSAGEILGGWFHRLIKRTFGAKEHAEEAAVTQHTSWFVVVTTSVFAVIATAAAFKISFTTLLLTMEAMGLAEVAHFGPISIDISALAAAVFLITPGRENKRLGWMFLTFSTGASIYGNLVGHAIQEERGAAPFHLPEGVLWEHSGLFFSVFFPLAMAILVHAAIKQVNGNLEHRKHVKAEESARAEREEKERLEAVARAKQEAMEAAERKRKADEAAAKRDELISALPTPKRKGEGATKALAVQYGVAHQVHTPATIGRVLEAAGFGRPSETTLKNAGRDIKQYLGVA